MSDPPLKITVDGTPYRIRGETRSGEGIVLLHGWGGDEDVMWAFEHVLPDKTLILSPRAPYSIEEGGYEWIEVDSSRSSPAEAYRPGADDLVRFLERMRTTHGLIPAKTLLIGFSQGTALCLAGVQLGMLQPAGIVVMAGFLPAGDDAPLSGLSVFWTHGRGDDVIPFDMAVEGTQRLRTVGADLTFCESRTAHKAGRECLRQLKAWIPAILKV